MNPWMILALLVSLALAYGLGRVHGADKQLTADQLTAAQVANDRDEADRVAREQYAAELAARDRQIEELRAAEAEAAAVYARELESARAVSAPITREVVRYVTANPSNDVCRVPARIVELRRAQIRAANATGRVAATAPTSRLQSGAENDPARIARADERRPGFAVDGRRFHHPGLWGSPPAGYRAGRMR